MAETDASASANGRHWLIDRGGEHSQFAAAAVKKLLSEGDFFWLDIENPNADDLALLDDLIGLHPLALEDARHFGQRPKLDEYDDFALLVAYGANDDDDGLVEVHCYFSDKFLVTVHHDDCGSFQELRRRVALEPGRLNRHMLLLHAVADSLVDSFFPRLSALDDRIDDLEPRMLGRPSDEQMQEIFELKRRLVAWRKVISPQRDLFARVAAGVVDLPNLDDETQRYYRDVYDHLIRISDLVDSYRDLLSGAMDLYLSTVSNRLNEIMKRLTIVATIFMPLTWITGFFGMNFPWLIESIGGRGMFIGLAIVTQVTAVVVMLFVFRRRGWM